MADDAAENDKKKKVLDETAEDISASIQRKTNSKGGSVAFSKFVLQMENRYLDGDDMT